MATIVSILAENLTQYTYISFSMKNKHLYSSKIFEINQISYLNNCCYLSLIVVNNG